MKKNYGFSYNDGDTIDKLKEARIPKKAIQGTPWYQALSNPKYAFLFNYTGVFVPERHKLIEDGSADPEDGSELSPELQMQRAEQSDFVMFMLNLAYVPDKVIEKLESFDHGWQIEVNRLMKEQQDEFSRNNYKWRFQDETMEKEYKDFYISQRDKGQVKEDRAKDRERFLKDMADLKAKSGAK